MKRIVPNWRILVVLIVLLGACVVLGARVHHLTGVRATLEANLDESEKKGNALKQKYNEEKNKGATLQKAKAASDSRVRELEASLAAAKTELAEAKKFQTDGGAQLEAAKKSIEAFSAELDKSRAAHDETKGKLREANADIKQKDAEAVRQQKQMDGLSAELKAAEKNIERIVAHNRELSKLSQELLAQFDKKNALTAMMEKEPFTQAKRVSLEKFIQEYLDKIDKGTLPGSEGK